MKFAAIGLLAGTYIGVLIGFVVILHRIDKLEEKSIEIQRVILLEREVESLKQKCHGLP